MIITDFTARPCRGRQIPQVSHLFLLWKENQIFLILNCLDQNVRTNIDNRSVLVAVVKLLEALEAEPPWSSGPFHHGRFLGRHRSVL